MLPPRLAGFGGKGIDPIDPSRIGNCGRFVATATSSFGEGEWSRRVPGEIEGKAREGEWPGGSESTAPTLFTRTNKR
jgi:hypothetical protein